MINPRSSAAPDAGARHGSRLRLEQLEQVAAPGALVDLALVDATWPEAVSDHPVPAHVYQPPVPGGAEVELAPAADGSLENSGGMDHPATEPAPPNAELREQEPDLPMWGLSAIVGSFNGTADSSSDPATNPPDEPPVIHDLWCSNAQGEFWEIGGRVQDENPAGMTITFGGEPDSLQGKTATVTAYGDFLLTLRLNSDGSDTGLATVTTSDGGGQASNEASIYISAG